MFLTLKIASQKDREEEAKRDQGGRQPLYGRRAQGAQNNAGTTRGRQNNAG